MPKRKVTHEDLLAYHEVFCDAARSVMRKKNKDYTGQHGRDPFANFTRSEALGICTTEQGFLVRMSDKLSRLATYCSCGKLEVQDESVLDTLEDTVNYCVLLAAYLIERDELEFPWEQCDPSPKSDAPAPAKTQTPMLHKVIEESGQCVGQDMLDNPGCCGEPEACTNE